MERRHLAGGPSPVELYFFPLSDARANRREVRVELFLLEPLASNVFQTLQCRPDFRGSAPFGAAGVSPAPGPRASRPLRELLFSTPETPT